MKYRTYLMFALVLISCSAPLVSAQEEGISYGDTITEQIKEWGETFTYTFEGSAGDLVLITMNKARYGELDPYLTLLDPEGVELAANDDGGFGYDALIVTELPTDGEYSILADTGLESVGIYTLSLNLANQLTEGVPVTAEELAWGTHTAIYLIKIEDKADALVTLSVVPLDEDLVPSIEVYTHDGESLIASGAGVGLHSFSFMLPGDAFYVVKVGNNDFFSTGDIEVTLIQE